MCTGSARRRRNTKSSTRLGQRKCRVTCHQATWKPRSSPRSSWGASTVVFLVVGAAARIRSSLGGYSDLGLYAAGLVLTWVAMAVVRMWFWTRWIAYDPYDPDGSFPLGADDREPISNARLTLLDPVTDGGEG